MEQKALKIGRGNRKLTYEQAEEIRELYFKTDIYQRELAEKYGVSNTTITNIVNGKIYRKKENCVFSTEK